MQLDSQFACHLAGRAKRRLALSWESASLLFWVCSHLVAFDARLLLRTVDAAFGEKLQPGHSRQRSEPSIDHTADHAADGKPSARARIGVIVERGRRVVHIGSDVQNRASHRPNGVPSIVEKTICADFGFGIPIEEDTVARVVLDHVGKDLRDRPPVDLHAVGAVVLDGVRRANPVGGRTEPSDAGAGVVLDGNPGQWIVLDEVVEDVCRTVPEHRDAVAICKFDRIAVDHRRSAIRDRDALMRSIS